MLAWIKQGGGPCVCHLCCRLTVFKQKVTKEHGEFKVQVVREGTVSLPLFSRKNKLVKLEPILFTDSSHSLVIFQNGDLTALNRLPQVTCKGMGAE